MLGKRTARSNVVELAECNMRALLKHSPKNKRQKVRLSTLVFGPTLQPYSTVFT